MYNEKRKLSKGLKILLTISFVLFALFVLFFVLYALNGKDTGDANLKNFGEVMKYHGEGIRDLFIFKFHNASNIIYFSLSGLLYGLIAICLIFLAMGIYLSVKKKRAVMALGIVLTLLTLVVYLLGATGLPKYWLIINGRDAFEDATFLRVCVLILIASGVLFAVAAYITYFVCVINVYKKPLVEVNHEETKQEAEQIVEEEPILENDDEPVMFEEIEVEAEPAMSFKEGASPAFEEKVKEQIKEQKDLDKNELAELIRNIVREEIKNNASAQQSSTPLVVQYFGAAPIEQKVIQPKEKSAPVKEEKIEPVAEPQKEEEIQVHDKIVVEQVKAPEYKITTEQKEEVEEEKNKIIRIPFQERMLNADEEMKKNYNELKNEILSYGVNSRVSNSGDAFRLHRKTYVKITIAGLSLKLYFALNPDDYKDSTIPVQNAGHKGIYAEIPLVFKVKSGLSMRRCKELIQTVMEKDGLEQGSIEDIDWVEKLKEQQNDADKDNED